MLFRSVTTPSAGKGSVFLDTNNQLNVKDSSGNNAAIPTVSSSANTQVLFNDAGSLGQTADFTFNKTTKVLTVNGVDIQGAINTVSNAVSVETANRTSADNALSLRIDSISNYASVTSQQLSVETANRTSADNALSVRVDNVSNAVSVVSNALSAEIVNRTSADNALSVRRSEEHTSELQSH